MFEYKPGVRYLVSASKNQERKALLNTISAGRQPITNVVKSSAVLILKGWTIEISGDDGSLFCIQPVTNHHLMAQNENRTNLPRL